MDMLPGVWSAPALPAALAPRRQFYTPRNTTLRFSAVRGAVMRTSRMVPVVPPEFAPVPVQVLKRKTLSHD